MEELIDEARALVELGARELNLIAQDTANYGWDLYGEAQLTELLNALKELPSDLWIRVLYAHPRHLTRKIVRKAFWELRHRREWDLERGVVWTSEEGGTSYVGLGELVDPAEPMPALTPMTTLGGSDG